MEILLLKAAIWALGHTSMSTDGIEYLNETAPQVYEKFIFLAKHCEVYSVRAVALHALGLVATTKAGADILFKYGMYFHFIIHELKGEQQFTIPFIFAFNFRLALCST